MLMSAPNPQVEDRRCTACRGTGQMTDRYGDDVYVCECPACGGVGTEAVIRPDRAGRDK